jgi:hypothetical protein
MKGITSGSRGLRRTGALAVVAAIAVLATACGVHVSFSGGAASTGSAGFRANLAYAHCMQTHGVPNFPDPTSPSESFHISGPPNGEVTGRRARANNTCQHLLPRGSVTTSSSH